MKMSEAIHDIIVSVLLAALPGVPVTPHPVPGLSVSFSQQTAIPST